MTTHSKSPGETTDLCTRFERIDMQVELDHVEVAEILSDAGIDASASLARLMGNAQSVDREIRKDEYAALSAARHRELEALQGSGSRRGRLELLSRMEVLRQQHPTAVAMYKDLTSIPDEDLESLVAELEFLTRTNDET